MHYGYLGISRETNLLSEEMDLYISQMTFFCSIPDTKYHNASWFSKLRKGLFYQNVLLGNSIKNNANNDVIKPHHKFNFSSCLNATVQLIATKNILVTNTNAQKNGFLTQRSQHHEMFKKSRKKNATNRGKKKQKKKQKIQKWRDSTPSKL